MIVFNGIDLIILAVVVVLFAICGILLVIDRIAYAVNKGKQKRGRKQSDDNV